MTARGLVKRAAFQHEREVRYLTSPAAFIEGVTVDLTRADSKTLRSWGAYLRIIAAADGGFSEKLVKRIYGAIFAMVVHR